MFTKQFQKRVRSFLVGSMFPIIGGAVLAGLVALMMWLVEKYR